VILLLFLTIQSNAIDDLCLDGVDDYVHGCDSDSLDVGDDESFTVEAWIYPKDWPRSSYNGKEMPIVNKKNAYKLSLVRSGYDYWTPSYMPGFGFSVHTAPNSIRSQRVLFSSVSTHQWYHIVGIVDKEAGKLYLFVNGKLYESEGVSVYNSSEKIYIGGPPESSKEEYFEGCVTEVHISNGVRYDDDFEPILAPFPPDVDTRALWHFDETVGAQEFHDASGNGNTLRLPGVSPPGDVNGDCKITADDASLVLKYVVGLIDLSEEQQQAADVTGDDTITAFDAALILQYTVGLITQFPAQGAPDLTTKDENQQLNKIVAELENTSLSPEQRCVLEQLMHHLWPQVLPKQSALLQNYPNPFNPETWLPYQLAIDSPITISIYNAKGQLIRNISLGIKKAGVYIAKDKAAYWDGRDSFGQIVANGVYFYTLQAGKFTATRRMLIVK